MSQERSGSYYCLSSEARFLQLLNSPDPAKFLKSLCCDIFPGYEFNNSGMENNPKVLLVGAYEPTDLPAGRFNAPTYGLQRIASFLRAGGIHTEVFSVSTLGKDKLLRHLKDNLYDYVGFSILGPTLPHDKQLMWEVKRIQPKAVIVVGGPVATARPDLLFSSAADYLVVGYGEDPLLNLIVALHKNHEEVVTPGLFIRSGNGWMGIPADQPTYEDVRVYSYLLDPKIGMDIEYVNPSGLYSKIPMNRTSVFRFMGQGFCPRGCVFCSSRNFLKLATKQNKVMYVSLSSQDRFLVIANILKQLPKLKTIFISDDDFFTNRLTAKVFFDNVIHAKNEGTIPDVNFIMSSRIDELDLETLNLAKKAGVILINIGVESFSETSLRFLSKGVVTGGLKVDKFINESLDKVLAAGITPSINLIVFHPDCDWSQIYETVTNALTVLEKGVEVNMTTYIRNYYGADILKDEQIPSYSYLEFQENSEGKKETDYFKTVLLPKTNKMQIFARRVIMKRSQIEESLKKEYSWSQRRAPQKVVQLVFLKALLEEAVRDQLMDLNILKTDLSKIDRMIRDEFVNFRALKTEEHDPEYPVLSLSPEHQKEALDLVTALKLEGLKLQQIKLIFDLKTGLFCSLFEDKRFRVIAPYLKYLFYGEEKTRFFHLDKIDKAILVSRLLRELVGLTEQQKYRIQELLLVDSEISDFIHLLLQKDILKGGVFQQKISRDVHEMLMCFNRKDSN